MADSKLLQLVRAFSPEEKRTFPLFLSSPFFVQASVSGEMQRLFDCLSGNLEKGISDKQGLHAVVFPDKPFSDARLERALTRFGQLLEQFLGISYYQSDDNKRQRNLDIVTVLRKKQMVLVYEKKLQKLKVATAVNLKESSSNYLFRYQLALEEHKWQSIFNQGKSDLCIPDLIENLNFFYCSERTELLNRFLLQQKISKIPTPESVRRVMEPLPDANYYKQQSPLIRITQKIQDLYMQTAPGKADFEQLMALLRDHEQSLSEEITPDLYSYLRNLCAILSYNGDLSILEVYHDIQKDNLARGYFYINGQIPAHALLSITRAAILVKDIIWAKQFLAMHRDKIITDDEPAAIYNLNLAVCFFAEKKFEEVLSLLPATSKYPQYTLTAKRFELMAYYELRSDLLSYKIDAFRKFLERTGSKTAANIHWRLNTNFVNLLQQLSQLALKDAGKSARLIERVHKKVMVAERIWLLEKAGELA